MVRFLYSFLFVFILHVSFADNIIEDSLKFIPNTQNLTSLGTLLNDDGTLNLSSGFSGNLDPSGFKLISKKGEAPRFSPVLADPDHNWFTSFQGEGFNGTLVYAIAISGTDIYVGGSFTEAGNIYASNIAKWDGVNWSPLGAGLTGIGSRVQ